MIRKEAVRKKVKLKEKKITRMTAARFRECFPLPREGVIKGRRKDG
jgi:hypothetical protein